MDNRLHLMDTRNKNSTFKRLITSSPHPAHFSHFARIQQAREQDERGSIQYVAQYPDGTSIRPLKTKTQFLRRPFQFSVNEVFRMKAEHFSFKMNVLASLKLAKQSQKTPFCSGE